MKRNWSVFQMIILVVFVALGIYILHQLLRYSGWGWFGFIATILWIALVFVVALLQPMYFWGNEALSDSAWVERLNLLGYLAIHYVSDILTMILIRDMVGFAAWGGFRAGWWGWDGYSLYSSGWTILSLTMPFVLLGLGYYTVWAGPYFRHVKIKDPRIPAAFDGFRIAHLSDIHLGPMMTDRLVRRMIKQLRRAKFDAIVLTGDIVDCDPIRYEENLWGLKEFEAPEGVYYCPGNHEYYWGFEKIRKCFDGTNIQVLQNETALLARGSDQISITGMPDPVSKFFPKARAFSWDEVPMPGDEYRILLVHQPYLADEAVKKGFHLQFSGHTHAGQFFPWNFFILFFQKYSKGLYRIREDKSKKGPDDLWLYVNQGTGFWGPPTRLGTYGEITLVELQRTSAV